MRKSIIVTLLMIFAVVLFCTAAGLLLYATYGYNSDEQDVELFIAAAVLIVVGILVRKGGQEISYKTCMECNEPMLGAEITFAKLKHYEKKGFRKGVVKDGSVMLIRAECPHCQHNKEIKKVFIENDYKKGITNDVEYLMEQFCLKRFR